MDVLIALLPSILGFLGQLIAAFLANWNATHGNDQTLATVIYGYVQSAAANPALVTNDQKYEWVWERTKEYITAEALAAKDSMINTLIELSLQKLKALKAAAKP